MSEVSTENTIEALVAAAINGATSRTLVARRIKQAEARIDKARQQQAVDDAIIEGLKLHNESLPVEVGGIVAKVGDVVVIKVGRGETVREEEAKVVLVAGDETSPDKYKVEVGSGFDAQYKIIFPAQIVSIAGGNPPAADDLGLTA